MAGPMKLPDRHESSAACSVHGTRFSGFCEECVRLNGCECDRQGRSKQDECIYDDPCPTSSIASPSLRLAYADPPYPGCAHLYPEKTEVDHVALVAKLCTYDGWALSTNENALQYVLGLCPPGVRVLAWCKTNAPPFFDDPIPGWEPVVLKPARIRRTGVRSYLSSEAPTGHRRRGDIPGHKPIAFCEWVIRCLGAERDDTLTDLFPGTGVMGETWERWRSQLTLDSPLASKGPRREVRERQLRANHPPLWNEVA
jgi:hypothetical protein